MKMSFSRIFLLLCLLLPLVFSQGTDKCKPPGQDNIECHDEPAQAEADCALVTGCVVAQREQTIFNPLTGEVGTAPCYACVEPEVNPPTQTGGPWGDPHVITYDRQRTIECFEQGEFILAKSDASPKFELQGRFMKTGSLVTVSTGVVLNQQYFPKIQLSVATLASTISLKVGNCPLALYVNDVNTPYEYGMNTFGLGRVTVQATHSWVRVQIAEGMGLFITMMRFGPLGCSFMRMDHSIPGNILISATIRGLLGTPNRDRTDDLITPEGVNVVVGGSHAAETAYCKKYWCVKHPKDSHFAYEPQKGFVNITKCVDPKTIVAEKKTCAGLLLDVCGTDRDCCFDGDLGGIDIAKQVLADAALADKELAVLKKPSATKVKIIPRVSLEGDETAIQFRIDVSSHPTSNTDGLEKFILREIDCNTEEPRTNQVELLDEGRPETGDRKRRDGEFSNKFLFTGAAGGILCVEFSPVFNGMEDKTSVLYTKSLDAVKVFSLASGVLTRPSPSATSTPSNTPTPSTTPSNSPSARPSPVGFPVSELGNTYLKVIFSWGDNTKDLDIQVEHARDKGGFGCFGFGMFVKYGELPGVSREEAKVLLGVSRGFNLWVTETSVNFFADWVGTDYPDAVELTTVMVSSASGGEFAGTKQSVTINPGSKSSVGSTCASTAVAKLEVTVTGTKVNFALGSA